MPSLKRWKGISILLNKPSWGSSMEKTDNELIAEFMGAKKVNQFAFCCSEFPDVFIPSKNWDETNNLKETFTPEEMLYSTSWDWLMPVVEKIGKLWAEYPVIDWQNDRAVDEFMLVCGLPLDTPIDKAYQAVVKFIKWYNENKQP